MPKTKGTATKGGRLRKESAHGTTPLAEQHALVNDYQKYVELVVSHLIRSMVLPTTLKEDFMSAGFLGLVEAAERFDPTRGFEFKGFAFLRIRGAVIDHIRNSCEVSRQTYRTLKSLEGAQELRELELERLDAGEQRREAKRAAALSYLAKSATAFKVARVIGDKSRDVEESGDDPEKILDVKRESKKIRRLVATLPEKERTIVEQYYFHDRNFTEIATAHAGLSKSWVSRLHDRALDLLREKISREEAAAAVS
jgi:RNA polymerase sigma factor for flagellar operon FliA